MPGDGIQPIRINRMRGKKRLLFLMIIVLQLNACYEDPQVVLHEAHVYKGKPDPHKQNARVQPEILRKRFEQVQLDR